MMSIFHKFPPNIEARSSMRSCRAVQCSMILSTSILHWCMLYWFCLETRKQGEERGSDLEASCTLALTKQSLQWVWTLNQPCWSHYARSTVLYNGMVDKSEELTRLTHTHRLCTVNTCALCRSMEYVIWFGSPYILLWFTEGKAV